jgi:hypothetical protein
MVPVIDDGCLPSVLRFIELLGMQRRMVQFSSKNFTCL